jgi:FKBP-type peptidyl-prolyl cis-trans isomerase SlyD
MAIENNMVVAFSYELKDHESGEILDASRPDAPLEFITGKSHIIPGLEKEILIMNVGDSGVIVVAPEEAYGIYHDEATATYPKEQFAGLDLEIGMPLYGQDENGATIQVIVKAFDEESVTIDQNHPLAGKTLAFAITIDNVREATVEEVMTGNLHCDDHGKEGGCGSGGGGGHGGCGCGH